jgi:hypothetical protein
MLLDGLIGTDRFRRPADDGGHEVLFFVHIPKCAGSSFRQVLKHWFGRTALFLDTHEASELEQAVARLGRPPRAIAGHMPFGLHGGLKVRPCYVSLVRHPLDRLVSIYQHAQRTPSNPMHAAAARLDFEAFYHFALHDPRARGRTLGVQCYFLSRARTFEGAREVIDRSYALLAPTDRYESFVEACAERFGRQAVLPPPRNVSPDGPIEGEVRSLLERRVEADHAEDLRLYRYVSETFDARRGSLSFALHA